MRTMTRDANTVQSPGVLCYQQIGTQSWLSQYCAGRTSTSPACELVTVEHPRVVNAAYFSPITGNKVMTTCIDNRVRVSPLSSLGQHFMLIHQATKALRFQGSGLACEPDSMSGPGSAAQACHFGANCAPCASTCQAWLHGNMYSQRFW